MSNVIQYRDVDTEFNPIRPITDAIRGAYCAGYSAFPALYNGSPGGDAATWAANQARNDFICAPTPSPLPPSPAPIAEGGQCAGVGYRIFGSVNFNVNGGSSSTNPIDLGGVVGAIQLGGLQEDGFGWYVRVTINITPSNPSGVSANAYLLLKPSNPQVFYEFEGYSLQIQRLDGQPDNCGNMKPDYPDLRLPPGRRITDNVDIPVRPGLNINLPVTIEQVNINNAVNVNVDVGGIGINFDFGGITVELPPGIGIPGFPDVLDGLDVITDGVGDLIDTVTDITDLVNSLNQTKLEFEAITIEIPDCDGENVVVREVPVKVLRDNKGNSQRELYQAIASQIRRLRTQGLIDCEVDVPAFEIISPETVEPGEVVYSTVQIPPTRGYLIEIVNFDAKELRTYKLAGERDVEAGFGNACIVNEDYSTRGDIIFMRTRRLFIDARDVDTPHRVRVSLKPGVLFRVVNLGYKKR